MPRPTPVTKAGPKARAKAKTVMVFGVEVRAKAAQHAANHFFAAVNDVLAGLLFDHYGWRGG